MPLFRKVLVANRGEIAVRVIRTCRVLGIPTVAVYSEADRDRAPRPRGRRGGRDRARRGAARPTCRSTALLAAARATGADAVHPGYGFLSQSGDFADAVTGAGLVFVGPPGDVHRRMGDKQAARRLMAAAGVPVVPGYDGDEQSRRPARWPRRARIGWPVMLKPSRGGGGKGMRVVRSEEGFADALAASRREARAAFGDDAMVLERFVERPAARRGPGDGRRAGPHRAPRRARVLRPAAAPEGRRGDAQPGPRRPRSGRPCARPASPRRARPAT